MIATDWTFIFNSTVIVYYIIIFRFIHTCDSDSLYIKPFELVVYVVHVYNTMPVYNICKPFNIFVDYVYIYIYFVNVVSRYQNQ